MTMPRSSRAFSLVEAVISTIIVATMFAAAVTAAGIAARDRRIQAEQRTGHALARTLISEIMAQRYADLNGGSILGLDAGKSTADRTTWTDVDDYTGLSEKPRSRDGVVLEGVSGWTWEAKVEYFTLPALTDVSSTTPVSGSLVVSIPLLGVSVSLGEPAAPADTGMKRITVTVTSPRGVPTTLTALRSSYGSANDAATGSGVNTWTGLSVQVGEDQRAITVGTEMLNRPQP